MSRRPRSLATLCELDKTQPARSVAPQADGLLQIEVVGCGRIGLRCVQFEQPQRDG